MNLKISPQEYSYKVKDLEKYAHAIKFGSEDADKFVKSQLSFMVNRRVEKDIKSWIDLKKDIDSTESLLLERRKEL